jgi:choline dehydrogenase-like flavoprotein
MIIDSLLTSPPKITNSDVCIVGGGPAGLTLAMELLSLNISVVLLESGNDSYNPRLQELYQGSLIYKGFDINLSSVDALKRDRLRMFGGTSNHWGGMCAPLDTVDFETRDWIPDSGWPFPRSHLAQYYSRASSYLKIPDYPHFEHRENFFTENSILGPEAKLLRDKPFSFSRIGNFGFQHKIVLERANNLRLYLNINALSINLDPKDLEKVDSITAVRGFRSDEKLLFKSKIYVMAAGAIENARLLLASNSILPAGVGNANDLVGRYFQGHGYSRRLHSFLMKRDNAVFANYETGGGDQLNLLAPTGSFQKENRILNFWIGINAFSDDILWPEAEGVIFAKDVMQRIYNIDSNINPDYWFLRSCQIFFEQEPSPLNRVKLIDEKDELGMLKVDVISHISDLQKETVEHAVNALGRELAIQSRGRAKLVSSSKGFMTSLDDGLGKHHHGTTRMHTNPKHGVVNLHNQVYGLNNLYAIGASTFPTSGSTNPTFTIVAMSIRFADILKKRIFRES